MVKTSCDPRPNLLAQASMLRMHIIQVVAARFPVFRTDVEDVVQEVMIRFWASGAHPKSV